MVRGSSHTATHQHSHHLRLNIFGLSDLKIFQCANFSWSQIHDMTWTPAAAITASTLMRRPSTMCIGAGTCFHSATKAFGRSGTSVGRLGLTRSLCSNSSQRCSMGLRSELDLDKQFLYGPCFVHVGIVMLKQERAFPKMLSQSWKCRIV